MRAGRNQLLAVRVDWHVRDVNMTSAECTNYFRRQSSMKYLIQEMKGKYDEDFSGWFMHVDGRQ